MIGQLHRNNHKIIFGKHHLVTPTAVMPFSGSILHVMMILRIFGEIQSPNSMFNASIMIYFSWYLIEHCFSEVTKYINSHKVSICIALFIDIDLLCVCIKYRIRTRCIIIIHCVISTNLHIVLGRAEDRTARDCCWKWGC